MKKMLRAFIAAAVLTLAPAAAHADEYHYFVVDTGTEINGVRVMGVVAQWNGVSWTWMWYGPNGEWGYFD